MNPEIIDATVINGHEVRGLSASGWLSWIVILLVVAFAFAMVSFSKLNLIDDTAAEASKAEMMQIQMVGKFIVGQQGLQEILEGGPLAVEEGENDGEKVGEGEKDGEKVGVEEDEQKEGVGDDEKYEEDDEITAKLPAALDSGPYEQRLGYTILVNELAGPTAALKHIKSTDERAKTAGVKLSEDQQRLRQTMVDLLDEYEMGNWQTKGVAQSDQEFLIKKMGWLGRLATAPPGTSKKQQREQVVATATTAIIKLVIAMLVGVSLAILGLVLAIVLLVMASGGRLKSRFFHVIEPASRHNIYVETFAIWIAMFFGVQIVLGLVLEALQIKNEMLSLVLMPVLFFGSLSVLVWPVLRGVSWTEVRADIGWKWANPFAEGSIALMCYVALLPGVLLAYTLVIWLMTNFGAAQAGDDFGHNNGPSHPIVEHIIAGDATVIGLLLVSLCLAAPIVEETMFRGVLYRHLRDWSAGWQRGTSVVLSALINSFIFAAIHPQGLFGIPLLMSLALGFSLVREWRGSLMASMMMHGVNNFIVTMFALTVM